MAVAFLALSCDRMELEPAAPCVAEEEIRKDGRLVFTLQNAPSATKGFLGGKTIDLGDGLSLRVRQEENPVFPEEETKGYNTVYSNAAPFNTFALICEIYSYESNEYRFYACDFCDRAGDRWITRKDWSYLASDAWYGSDEYPPRFFAVTIPTAHSPEFSVFPDEGAEFLCNEQDFEDYLESWCMDAMGGITADDLGEFLFNVRFNLSKGESYAAGDFYPCDDVCFGYGTFDWSMPNAIQTLSFRHLGAAVTVKAGLLPDGILTNPILTCGKTGSFSFYDHDWADGWRPTYCTSGTSGATDMYFPADVTVGPEEVNAWLVSPDDPFMVPPQRDGQFTDFYLELRHPGGGGWSKKRLAGINFPSGTNTILEIVGSGYSFSVPNITCVWNSSTGYNDDGEGTISESSIPSSVFNQRVVTTIVNDTYGCALTEFVSDGSDDHHLTFHPKWTNFTADDWTESFSVTVPGIEPEVATLTIERQEDEGGDSYYGDIEAHLPRYCFLGDTITFDAKWRLECSNPPVVLDMPPFMYSITMRGNAANYLQPVGNCQYVAKAVTDGIKYIDVTLSDPNGHESLYCLGSGVASCPFEVVAPSLTLSVSSLSFTESESTKSVGAYSSVELRDTTVNGRKLWVLPQGRTAGFSFDASEEYLQNVNVEYFTKKNGVNFSSVVTTVGLGACDGERVYCYKGHYLTDDMYDSDALADWDPYGADPMTGLSLTSLRGTLYFDLVTMTSKPVTVSSHNTWKIASCPSWVMTSLEKGKDYGTTSAVSENSYYVYFSVLPNPNNESRTGEVVFTTTDGSNLTRTLTVTQAAFTGPSFNEGGFSGGGFNNDSF